MTQYKNIFGSCRVPLVGGDKLEFTSLNDESSKNVLIINNNQFFVFNAHDERGVPFDEGMILALLLRVADMSREDGTPIGILTTDERDAWAEAHERLCQNPRNAASLQAIRKAAFAVCLDRKLHNSEPYEVTSGQQLFAGGQDGENAANRWWDKTIQLVVGKEGLTGFLFEHSSIDATMGAALADYCMAYIGDSGPVVTPKEAMKVDIIKLEFNIEPETLEDIAMAKSNQARFRANSDKLFFKFTKYGKNSVKSWKLSPDSYVQMALQLACYKRYCLYISIFSSKFLEALELSIEAFTPHNLAFIYTTVYTKLKKKTYFENDGERTKKKTRLSARSRPASAALYQADLHMPKMADTELPVASIVERKSAIQKIVIEISMVSTECDSATFFEPFVSDGYAIFYNVQSDSLTFAISSCKSCPETSSAKFKEALEKSLVQMGDCVVRSDQDK
ncbi:unnamed protein product [Ixodes pacificus]